MTYRILAAAFLAAVVAPYTFAADPPAQKPSAEVGPANPAIDMAGYLKVSREAAAHRATRRVTEEEFLKMSGEKGTVVLDARSKDKFDLSHVKGAVNLSFPDIDAVNLPKTLPDKDARILIYCNNNFTPAAGSPPAGRGASPVPPAAFQPKKATASLNLSTYIALYTYGYRNVYELAPLIDPAKTKLTLVPTAK